MSLTLRGTLLCLGLALVAGCSDDLAKEGEACSTSAECAPGLLCDSARDPAVCAKTGGPRPDLAGVDLAGIDLSEVDLAGADLAGADLAAPQGDLALADLAQVDMAQGD